MMKQNIIRSSHTTVRGFEYLVYSAISLCLLVVMLLLPLAPAFASEDPDILPEQIISDESESEDAVNQDEFVEDTESPESPILLPTPELVDQSIEVPEENVDVVENLNTVEETGVIVLDVPEETEEEIISNNASSTEPEVEEPIEAEEVVEDIISENESTTTPLEEPEEIIEPPVLEEVIEEISTSSEETLIVTSTLIDDEHKFSFAKNECTATGEGSFYCVKSTGPVVVGNIDRVFSALDSDGDKEIYIEKSGELTQITDNDVDDDAPYFDSLSNSITWHRLVGAEYQILSYDVDEGVETQLTFDRYNNMEPNRHGDTTVWQGWMGSDWEIFLLEKDELTILTDNDVHDTAPYINDTYIVWQSFEGNSWRMKVYDMRTKNITTIEDADGGSIQNPRFVLVYDTKFETGDVETRGYDLKSGEVIALGSTPAPVPTEIPDPDQTDEERALIAPPAQVKVKVEGADDDTDDDNSSSTPNTASSTDSSVLVIPPLATGDGINGVNEDDEIDTELTEVGTSTEDVHIDTVTEIHDLIITPFIEPVELEDIE